MDPQGLSCLFLGMDSDMRSRFLLCSGRTHAGDVVGGVYARGAPLVRSFLPSFDRGGDLDGVAEVAVSVMVSQRVAGCVAANHLVEDTWRIVRPSGIQLAKSTRAPTLCAPSTCGRFVTAAPGIQLPLTHGLHGYCGPPRKVSAAANSRLPAVPIAMA